ncbi:MAG: hypothetical protein R2867_38970 [Caldilineaceae bacterium]
MIGDVIPLNLMGNEINHCGEMFATGFTLSNDPGEWFGDTNLYRVDRESGALTLIGDTGIERIMDLSFDPEGTLGYDGGNVLYTLDLKLPLRRKLRRSPVLKMTTRSWGLALRVKVLYATTPTRWPLYH